MDFKSIWKDEKLVIKKCANNIRFDSILTDTLQRLLIETDEAIVGEFNCCDKYDILITTLENTRYLEDMLRKATPIEKSLVDELLNSLYLLKSTMNNSYNKTKEQVVSVNKLKETTKLPNNKENVNHYKDLWSKSDSVNYTEINNMMRYRK